MGESWHSFHCWSHSASAKAPPPSTTQYNQAHVGNCTQLVEHAGTRVDDCTSNLGMTYLNGREGKTVEQSTNYINANGVGPEK